MRAIQAVALIPLTIALLALSSPAFAERTELQLEYGQCRLGQSKDGDFWQGGKETHNYLTPRCASIGFSRAIGSSQWRWGLAFLATGPIESRGNVATFRDDEKSQTFAPSDCQDDGHGCMTRHHGSGDLKGLRVNLAYRHELGGRWRLEPEVGLLFYRVAWQNETKWIDGEGPARFCNNPECRRIRTEELPGNYDHSEWKDLYKSAPALTLGAGLCYSVVCFVMRGDKSFGHRALSLTNGNMVELMLRVAIPFGD